MPIVPPSRFAPHPLQPFTTLHAALEQTTHWGDKIYADESAAFGNCTGPDPLRPAIIARQALEKLVKTGSMMKGVDHFASRMVRLLFPDIDDKKWREVKFYKIGGEYIEAVKSLLLILYAFPVSVQGLFPKEALTVIHLNHDNLTATLKSRLAHIEKSHLVRVVLDNDLLSRCKDQEAWDKWVCRKASHEAYMQHACHEFPVADGILESIAAAVEEVDKVEEDEGEAVFRESLVRFAQGLFHSNEIDSLYHCLNLQYAFDEQEVWVPSQVEIDSMQEATDNYNTSMMYNHYDNVFEAPFTIIPRFTAWDADNNKLLNLIWVDNRRFLTKAEKAKVQAKAESLGVISERMKARGRLGVEFTSPGYNLWERRYPGELTTQLSELCKIGKFEGYGHLINDKPLNDAGTTKRERIAFFSMNADVTNFHSGYQRHTAIRLTTPHLPQTSNNHKLFEGTVKSLRFETTESSKPTFVETRLFSPDCGLEVPMGVYLMELILKAKEDGVPPKEVLAQARTAHLFGRVFKMCLAAYSRLTCEDDIEWINNRPFPDRLEPFWPTHPRFKVFRRWTGYRDQPQNQNQSQNQSQNQGQHQQQHKTQIYTPESPNPNMIMIGGSGERGLVRDGEGARGMAPGLGHRKRKSEVELGGSPRKGPRRGDW